MHIVKDCNCVYLFHRLRRHCRTRVLVTQSWFKPANITVLSHFHRKIYHNFTKTIVLNSHFTSNFRAMHHVKIAVFMQNCTKSNAMCTEAFHWNHGGTNMQIYDYSVCVCKRETPAPKTRKSTAWNGNKMEINGMKSNRWNKMEGIFQLKSSYQKYF